MLAKSSQSRNFFRSKIEFVFFAVNCVTRNSRYIVLLLSFKPRILPGWPYLPLLRTSEASHTSSRRVCSPTFSSTEPTSQPFINEDSPNNINVINPRPLAHERDAITGCSGHGRPFNTIVVCRVAAHVILISCS